MTQSNFLINLVLSIVGSIVLFYLINLGVPLIDHVNLLFISVLFFSLYNVALYFLSLKASRSKIKNQFIHLVLYNVFIKIICAFVLIFVYVKAVNPESKLFIVPFVIAYFVFTIFETYFMSIQARK